MNDDESWAEVVSVKIENKALKAYNLTVFDYHTYFVKGADNANANPVWVHNDCFDDRKIFALLGGKRKFHKKIKQQIKEDLKKQLKKAGVNNPDVGYDSAGNIIFRNPVTKVIILRTDVPITSYGD